MARQGTKLMVGGAAIAALFLTLTPAVSAVVDLVRVRSAHPVSLTALGSISSFTPATRDSRLARAYARLAVTGTHGAFRFTPTSGSLSGSRSITIAVRTDAGADASSGADRNDSLMTITPVSYNLGTARGWKRFALADTVGARPIDPLPVLSMGHADGFVLPAKDNRANMSAQLESERAVGSTPRTLAGEKVMSVDLTSSYSLTRNFDVTAGVRYKGPNNNRLSPLTDTRQDSQAVYVGTVFKF